jgi:flavin reductase (DIM6/NTAB) family NADH-FMN oxidoreductase RutF/rubredoxin
MNTEALFKITYGLYVVSSKYESVQSGYISNTVMQVTNSPVQLAICASKNNLTTELIRKSGKVALAALCTEVSKEIITTFGYKSGKEIDKFASVRHFYTPEGLPVLTENTIAWFTGEIVKEIEFETHIMFIVAVSDSDITNPDTEPITYDYYRKVMRGKAPKSAPTYQEPAQTESNDSGSWVCSICGHEYNPAEIDSDSDVAPGTPFEELPDDWLCPTCRMAKSYFKKTK